MNLIFMNNSNLHRNLIIIVKNYKKIRKTKKKMKFIYKYYMKIRKMKNRYKNMQVYFYLKFIL